MKKLVQIVLGTLVFSPAVYAKPKPRQHPALPVKSAAVQPVQITNPVGPQNPTNPEITKEEANKIFEAYQDAFVASAIEDKLYQNFIDRVQSVKKAHNWGDDIVFDIEGYMGSRFKTTFVNKKIVEEQTHPGRQPLTSPTPTTK